MQNNRKSNSMKNILNSFSGITLIALVVTIVVLLILASVSITVVFGDDGILQLAKEAGEKTDEAVQGDKENIGNATNYIKSLSWDTSKVTAVTTKDGAIVPVPKGFVGSEVDGENTIKDGFVIYEGDSAVTNENVETSNAREERNQFVWVPADGVSLEYKQDKETWKNNAYGYNDYTDWTDNEELERRQASVSKYGGFYVARYEAGVPESKDYDNDTNYQEKSNAENRNRSDVEEKDLPASKKGLQSWNYVTQKVAKELSSKMYENKESVRNSVTSRLIDSYAWDTICKWFSNSGINVTDSTLWGNYLNTSYKIKGLYAQHIYNATNDWEETEDNKNYKKTDKPFGIPSGRNDEYEKNNIRKCYEVVTGITVVDDSNNEIYRNRAKNIYDFAGNMWEWTTEIREEHDGMNETSYAVMRGGSFSSNGDFNPASVRHGGNPDSGFDRPIGFRPVLYLK